MAEDPRARQGDSGSEWAGGVYPTGVRRSPGNAPRKIDFFLKEAEIHRGAVGEAFPFKPLVESILTPFENENLGDSADDYRSKGIPENGASAGHLSG